MSGVGDVDRAGAVKQRGAPGRQERDVRGEGGQRGGGLDVEGPGQGGILLAGARLAEGGAMKDGRRPFGGDTIKTVRGAGYRLATDG